MSHPERAGKGRDILRMSAKERERLKIFETVKRVSCNRRKRRAVPT
jgi:hypothetical protein